MCDVLSVNVCGAAEAPEKQQGKAYVLVRSFVGSRVTFLRLGSTSAGFGGCVWNFLKAKGSQIFAFHCDESFHL